MIIQGQVGQPATTSIASGSNPVMRQGQLGDVIASELHGRYYEGSYRKNRFGGAMQAVIATATIAGFSTTITGVPLLYNPPGSAVNVVIETVQLAFVVASANALAYGLATGFSNTAVSGTLTSLTPKSKFIGSGVTPVAGLVASASMTLPVAATGDTILGSLSTAAVSVPNATPGLFDIGGAIVLPPGGYCHVWTSAILAASSLLAGFSWEEVPV